MLQTNITNVHHNYDIEMEDQTKQSIAPFVQPINKLVVETKDVQVEIVAPTQPKSTIAIQAETAMMMDMGQQTT